MSGTISWANRMQLAKCDIMVGFPISSHIYIYMYTVNQVLLIAFEFEKSIKLQFMEFYFGEMAC